MDTYLQDASLQFSDGAAAVTVNGIAQVAAASAIIDFGGAPSRTDLGVGAFGFTRGAVVVDVTAIDISSTDESYRLDIMGSNNADGSKPVHLGGLALGYGTTIPNGAAGSEKTGAGSDTVIGRRMIYFTSRENDVNFRYVYMYVTVGGTTPSITFKAYASIWPEA